MGYVDDYLGGYENLVYDSDGCADLDASYEVMVDAAVSAEKRGSAGGAGGGSRRRRGPGGGAHRARAAAPGGDAGGASGSAAAAAPHAAGGLNPRAAAVVRQLLASGEAKQALHAACSRQRGGPLAYEYVCVAAAEGGWRATVVLGDARRFASASAHARKRDAETDAAAVATLSLLPAAAAPAAAPPAARTQPAAPQAPASLVGQTVLLTGLQTRPELNGRAARCGELGADGRYDAFVFGTPAGIRVRPECLLPAQLPRAGPAPPRDAPLLLAYALDCAGRTQTARVPLPDVADVRALAELRHELRARLPLLRHPRVVTFDLVRLDHPDEAGPPRGRPAQEDGVSWLRDLSCFRRLVAAGAEEGGAACAVVLQSHAESLLDLSPLSDMQAWDRAAGKERAAAAQLARRDALLADVRAGVEALARLRPGTTAADLPRDWVEFRGRTSPLERLLCKAVDAKDALARDAPQGAASDAALMAAAVEHALAQPGANALMDPRPGRSAPRVANDLFVLAMRARVCAPGWRMPHAAGGEELGAGSMARMGLPSLAAQHPALWIASAVQHRARFAEPGFHPSLADGLPQTLEAGRDLRKAVDELSAALAVALRAA
jgi:hypothetical protein